MIVKAARAVTYAALAGCAALIVGSFLSGCAIQVPLVFDHPSEREEQQSAMAEGAWLVLDMIDTMQTVQIAKSGCYTENDPVAAFMYGGQHPSVGRIIAVNLPLAFAHTWITSWLDSEVSYHMGLNDDSVGPWYVGRVAWHAVSLGYSTGAVIHNYSIGLTPTSYNPCPVYTAPPSVVISAVRH